MTLSAEGFEALLESVRKAEAAAAGQNRRAPRVGVRAQVLIVPIENGVPGPQEVVRVRDVSAGGLSLLRAKALRPGRQIVVTLPRTDDRPTRIMCEVRHCRPVGEDLHSIGCMFLKAMGKLAGATVQTMEPTAPAPKPAPPPVAPAPLLAVPSPAASAPTGSAAPGAAPPAASPASGQPATPDLASLLSAPNPGPEEIERIRQAVLGG